MKLVCVDVQYVYGTFFQSPRDLTVGRIYEPIDESGYCYYLTDDTGLKFWHLKKHFMTLDEYRSKQIELLT